jgi:RNA polymerase sigma factor (TIGR02999 family)
VSEDLTLLIRSAGSGDGAAVPQLFEAVYGELKQLARRQLASGPQPTLDTTGLVHEAYLKLTRPQQLMLRDRAHFFATAAKAMRQIVIDHARRRLAEKRGGPAAIITQLDEGHAANEVDPDTLVRLDQAMHSLQTLEPRLAELVELRFFAGLSVEQVAELRDVTPRTVIRDWRRARAWLYESVQVSAS